MAIIAVSGKINSGKDTVGKIIQYLDALKKYSDIQPSFEEFSILSEKEIRDNPYLDDSISDWEIKKFADKLKDIVCLLLSCTREQLEDSDFKNKELGEEWWYYKTPSKSLISYLDNNQPDFIKRYELIKTTPRLLLQLLGTECGRDILHPNIWVNALMSEYVPIDIVRGKVTEKSEKKYLSYPSWCITDMRFPNEMEAVKNRGGITIRINRTVEDVFYQLGVEKFGTKFTREVLNEDTIKDMQKYVTEKEHPSETSLDNAEFDYVIHNNGTIEELIEKVKIILIEHYVIQHTS